MFITAAGSHFDTNQGAACPGESYSTYSPSAQALGSLIRQGLKRIAFVGTPCQIKSIRKMQALKIVPSDAIKYYFGLFCTANFDFSGGKVQELEKLAGCKMQDVKRLNIKDDLILHKKERQEKRTERSYSCRLHISTIVAMWICVVSM